MAADLVIFDFFGVFCTDFVADWLRAHNLTDRGPQLIQDHVHSADLGRTSFDDQCAGFARDLGMDTLTVRRELLSFAHMDLAVVRIMEMLKGQAKIALLSNAPRGVVETVLSMQGVALPLDGKVISADVGLMKPDAAIYRHALDLMGSAAPRAIMIDDRRVNIDAAVQLGMTGIEFTTAAALAARLSSLGFAMT